MRESPANNAFVLSLLIVFSIFSAGIATAEGTMDSPERNSIEALVRDSLLSWETGNEEQFTSTAHPDLLFAFPGERTDTRGALNVFRFWQEKFKDTRVYIHWILIDGNRFAVEYQFATTRVATGERSAMGTVAIGEVREGKIILLKEYTDGRGSRMQESGELPLDEGQEPFPWPKVDRINPWSEMTP